MKSDFFIDRPVFSTVISVIIVLVGLIGLVMLPVDQYPPIVPPVVKVSASYPGASAQTVAQAVATPIEQELNGTPGMLYMESTNTNSGSFSATITFDITSNPDLAAVEVQNRVKLAESRLPAEVVQNGISVEKESASRLMTITVLSDDPKFDEIYLSNYTTLNVLDMLRRVPGVGGVSNVGSRYYAMQIWVQPDKLASFGLTVKDLQNALKDQNRESAAGVLGQQPINDVDITIPITATGRLSSVGEFENIVVRAGQDGSIIRIKDVARVSLEAQSYNTESGINARNAAVMNVYLLPGANAMEVAGNIRATMEEISRNFPEGMTYDIPFDVTSYISESIHHVYKTLFEALFLVILVVFLSLQSWRATLIPAIAVPISLVGTFGIMLIFGFSLNMMTLLGLILAIGIVVDDAIVVVENVDRIMEEEHLSPYEATKKAMSGIGGALIAMSLVLCAVFVPVSFLSGITGQLFRQFTVTIAVSVIISTIVALTLSPVMCSIFLKPHDPGKKKNIIFRKINDALAKGNSFYARMIHASLRHSRRMFAFFGVAIVGIWVMGKIVPSSFIPKEDQGYFTVELELPVGATLERTREVTDRAMAFLLRQHDIQYVLNVTGSSPRLGTSQGNSTLTVIMKPWDERNETDIEKTMQLVRDSLSRYPESKVYISTPAVIPGLGSTGGFSMVLETRGDATYEQLQAASDTLLYYAYDDIEFRSGIRVEGLMGVGIVVALQNLSYAPVAGGYESLLLNMGFTDNLAVMPVPPENIKEFMSMSFYLFDAILAAAFIVLLPFVNVEKKLPTINAELLRRKKEAVLAKGEVWLEPAEQDRIEREQAEKEHEENRIADLKDLCAKKGLDFETENSKYLAAQAEKKRKWEEKQAAKKAKAEAKLAEKNRKRAAKGLSPLESLEKRDAFDLMEGKESDAGDDGSDDVPDEHDVSKPAEAMTLPEETEQVSADGGERSTGSATADGAEEEKD